MLAPPMELHRALLVRGVIAFATVHALASCGGDTPSDAPPADDRGGARSEAQAALDHAASDDESADRTEREPSAPAPSGSGPVADTSAAALALGTESREASADRPASASPAAAPESLSNLRQDIASLQALLGSSLPDAFDTQQLFEVDLLSPSSVQARRDALTASIARGEARLREEVSTPAPAPDAPPQADAGSAIDAGTPQVDGGGAATSGAGPESPETTSDGETTTAPDTASAPLFDAAARERLELEVERDRLRLLFLSRPEAEREGVIVAERERRRGAAEREAAAERVSRAGEDERRAADARREALDRASTSTSALERELLALRAQIELERTELAAFAGSMARLEASLAANGARRTELVLRVERRRPTASPAQVDTLYDEVVEALVEVRAGMGEALDALGAPSDVPPPSEALGNLERFATFPEDLSALRDARAELDSERARLTEQEHEVRLDRATRLASELRSLNALRLALIEYLSRSHREEVMGLGPQGIAQLRRELTQLWLTARLWRWELERDAPQVGSWTAHVLARESSRLALLRLIAELALAVILAQRRKRVMEVLRDWLAAQKSSWLRVLTPWAELIARLAVATGIIVLVAAALETIESLAPRPEISAIRVVVIAYALYRLVLQLTHETLIDRIVANTGVDRGPTSLKARSTLRLLLAFAFGTYVTLTLAEAALGRGYLHTSIEEAARWLVVLLVAGVILRWRAEISAHQRTKFPESRLSAWLADDKPAPTRLLATFPAAAYVTGRALWNGSGDVLLRFERSRRAAAFLFRRRLEESDSGGAEREALPEALTALFEPGYDDESLHVEYGPKIDEVTKYLDTWAAGGSGTTLALVGERGIGKTMWMHKLLAARTERVISIDLPDIHSSEAFCGVVAEALELPAAENVDGLVDAIVAADLRVIVSLDHCQNLVVRAIGGTDALVALSEVSARTSDRIVWITSFSRYTWLYLARVRQSASLFQEVIELGPWPEEILQEFLDRRMQRSGFTVSYEALAIASVGAATEDTIARTQAQFMRMLWDYCDGNPRIAMAFWLRSLSPLDEGRLRVRYFDGPEPSQLDELSEAARFMLAAVVVHENLSTEDAARTMSFSTRQASAALSLLASRGFIERDESGKWRVRTVWYRAVIRHLRRQRLLFT